MMMRRRRRQKARHLQQSLRTRPVWLFCACSGSAVTCKHSFLKFDSACWSECWHEDTNPIDSFI